MSGARPPTPHAGKSLSLRHSDAVASTIGQLDAASFTRLKLSEPIRRNSNALTEVDAEPSLARFPIARSGMRRSRPQPDMTRVRETSFAHTCMIGDCERPDSVSRKNAASASQTQSVEHQTLHLRSRRRGRRADASVFPGRRAWSRECMCERTTVNCRRQSSRRPKLSNPRNGLRYRQAL